MSKPQISFAGQKGLGFLPDDHTDRFAGERSAGSGNQPVIMFINNIQGQKLTNYRLMRGKQ